MAGQKNENDIEDICPRWLKKLLLGLRSTNKYNDSLNNLIFNLELPEDTSRAAAEALIILAADDLDNSLDRDATLAALGLVRGCSRLEQPKHLSPRNAASWRRIQFLLKSSFLQNEDEYHQCEMALKSIESLKGHKVGKILTKLNKKDAEYIKNIASKIYQWYDCHVLEERLEFALKKYLSYNDGSYVDLENLPTLANPREIANNECTSINSIKQGDIRQENLLHETSSVEMADALSADSVDDVNVKSTLPDALTNNGEILPSKELEEGEEGDCENNMFTVAGKNSRLADDAKMSEGAALGKDIIEGDDPFVPSEYSKKELPKWIKIVASFMCTIIVIIVLANPFIDHFNESVKTLIYLFLFVVLLVVMWVFLIIYQRILCRITEKRGTNTWRYRSYTTRQIQEGKLGNRIILNSISDGKDDGGYNGNEKKFMLAQEVNEATDNVWQSGTIEVEDQKEYLLRIYVCNDNPGGRDAVAEGVMIDFFIPQKSSKEIRVWGMISAKNTHPKKYTDSILFTNNWYPFHLEYDYEPIKLYNSGIGKNEGYSLGHEDLFTQMYIGYDSLDGSLPGGDEFSTSIILKAKVVFDNSFIINYQVTHFSDSKEWKDETVAKVDDRLTCRIRFKNISNETQHNVSVAVMFPKNLHYISSFDSKLDDMYRPLILDSPLAIGAPVNIGDYAPGSVATICFDMEIVDNDLALGNNELISYLQVEIDDLMAEDYIKILVNKE